MFCRLNVHIYGDAQPNFRVHDAHNRATGLLANNQTSENGLTEIDDRTFR